MDNFTHSLAGWALGQAGLKTKSRKGLAALILGANMPDIDIFFQWVNWAPLEMHRGFTHGLVGGVLVMPPFLAGLLWLLDRWQVSRGRVFKSGLAMHFGWLVALSYIGAVTHPLLDLQNTYAVQLFSPLSNLWYHNDALFIIDVWLWVGMAFAIGLSRHRERKGGDWRRPAQVALVAAVAYIGANAGLSVVAKRTLIASGAATRPDVVFAGHEPAFFWNRNMVWREDGRVGRADYNLVDGLHAVKPLVADNMTDPLAVRARTANRGIVTFLRWSLLPIATVAREPCRALVSFGDARFGGPSVRATFERKAVLPLAGPSCPPTLAKLR
ncbi:MAG: metal-dependent hydrolase [Sphingomicrobium sp.]